MQLTLLAINKKAKVFFDAHNRKKRENIENEIFSQLSQRGQAEYSGADKRQLMTAGKGGGVHYSEKSNLPHGHNLKFIQGKVGRSKGYTLVLANKKGKEKKETNR